MRVGVRVKAPVVRVVVVESKSGRGGAFSGGVRKRPVAPIGGSWPPVGRVSIGRPRKVGAAATGLVVAPTFVSTGGTGVSVGPLSATKGASTGLEVSTTEGGPLRERWEWLSRALPEAAEDPGGLGMSTSGIRKRIKMGT